MTEFLVYATLASVRSLKNSYFGPGAKGDVLDVCSSPRFQIEFWMFQEDVEGLLEGLGSTEAERAMWWLCLSATYRLHGNPNALLFGLVAATEESEGIHKM